MDDFFRELVKNPPLLEAVVAFNLANHAPGKVQIDPILGDGQAGLNGPLQALVASEVKKNPKLRRFFPGGDALGDFWDFGPEPLRLTLLSDADFGQLALRFGAAVWGEVLAKAVDAKTVRALKANLGEELLDWAVDRGRFWLGDLGDFYRQSPMAPQDREGLRLSGLGAINVAWSPLPPGLAAKVGGRVVAESQMPNLGGHLPANLAARTFARLKNLLLTEVAPSWRPCFS
ncbi:MAG: Yop proteins translocation protein K [Deltaproteobacteria bacterium]|jgi:hypothetical protein|nr:Yop proteins translocation protein K [Deltaproteobacteria bacterium]